MESINILLVDDHPDNLLALEATLKQPGYNLVSVRSGKDALRELLQRDFALILLDAQMPDMDGFETARLVRMRERSRFTPIIFVTAIFLEEKYFEQGYASGAVDYITKPFNPDILRAKVAVFAELYRQKLQIHEQAEVISKERALKDHFNAIMNGLDHSIIWEFDPGPSKFLFVSKRAEMLLGYPHEKWFSEAEFFFKCVPTADRELLRSRFAAVIATGEDQRFEHRMTAEDGSERWFHTGLQCEKKGRAHQATIQGLSVDITPLKLSEEKYKSRAAKYRRVVDANMLGHFFAHLTTGAVTEANECFLQMVGYTRDDLLSGKVSWFDMTPPEYRPLDEQGRKELIEAGVCEPFEKEYFRKDGSRVPVLIGAARIEEASDECVCFALDLSQQKRTEQEKLRAVRAREEMLEIVAHDLKNPLSAILLNAVLLLRRVPEDAEPSGVRKIVEGIERSASRMKRLIEDLLDLAKVEEGRIVLEKASCDPRKLIEETIEMLRSSAKEKNINIRTQVIGKPSVITCDHDRMLQVFSNIVGNAVKFTPRGGEISIELEEMRGEYHFRFSDTGPGIEREALAHFFDRYWQHRKTGRQGTGLGLAIAKGIVDAHHGSIRVESELGKGTTFEIAI